MTWNYLIAASESTELSYEAEPEHVWRSESEPRSVDSLASGNMNKQGRMGECKNNHLSDFFQAVQFYSPKQTQSYQLKHRATSSTYRPSSGKTNPLPSSSQVSSWRNLTPDSWFEALYE